MILRALAVPVSSCISMRRWTSVAVIGGVWLTMTAGSAHADPGLCQRAITGGTARYAQARMKTLQKCWDEVVNGRAGACPDGKASAKITKAGLKLHRLIGKACGGGDANCGTGNDDDSLASIGWDLGTCPNLAGGSCDNPLVHCGDVADCVQCGAETAIDQTLALTYGSPNLSNSGPAIERCQRAIGTDPGVVSDPALYVPVGSSGRL